MATRARKRPAARRSTRRRPLTFQDVMAVERLSAPAVSPDGERVAFVATRVDPVENESRSVIRLLDLASGKIRDLTPGPGNHSQPAWSPDGAWLAFVSDRDEKAGSQLWVLPAHGGEALRITSGYGGVQAPLWAPDSRRLLFARQVVVSPHLKPRRGETIDPREGPARARIHGLANPKSSARVADGLLFRHWKSWTDRHRNHLFLVDAKTGRLTDVTPEDRDAPPISLGSARDYDFHPDGKEIAFVANPDPMVARSTNNSIWLQKIAGIRAVGKPRCISTSSACDCHPRYTADGSGVVYLAMAVPGYEADRNRVKIHDRKSRRTRTWLERFDRSPDAFELLPAEAGGGILFGAEDRGRRSLYRLDPDSGAVRQLTQGTNNGVFRAIPGSADLLVARQSTTEPTDFHRVTPGEGFEPAVAPGPAPPELPPDAGAVAKPLTRTGKALARVTMSPAEEFWYEGADGDPIHGFLIRPPGFRPRRRYPLILLIHGGPQAAWQDSFHYRWNAQLFASRGAVVALVNPRGSTGYGQRLTDQISGDWGGRCYEDILRGLEHVLASYRFIDGARVAAAGASFGGFMVNWIAGHTDRFRALVSHDGIFNAETMGYTTEELWFDEYEHGGTPYEKPQAYRKYSPHRFVEAFATPMLVIHGDQDFRCPISEGIGLFTALQMRGVPSRFLHFPDEGHWVERPANAQVWYDEVLDWLMRHLG